MSWNKLTAGSWNNNAVLLWILDASISFFRIQHIEHEQYRIRLFRLIISSDDDEIDPLFDCKPSFYDFYTLNTRIIIEDLLDVMFPEALGSSHELLPNGNWFP